MRKVNLKLISIFSTIALLVSGLSMVNVGADSFSENTSNLLTNAGFESSTSVTQKHADWYEMTTGWKTSWASSSKFTLNISTDEAHSGSKSFKVDVLDSSELAITTSVATYDSTAKAMIATGYDPTEEYIVSYWYKGSAITRFRTYTGDDNAEWSKTWQAETIPDANEWQLNTQKLTPTASGKLSWLIYIKSKGTTAYIDDISLMTVENAKAAVQKMINDLDIYSDNAESEIAEIEAWVEALGKENISNYTLFTQKLNGNNLLTNPGFESPTDVKYVTEFGKIMDGWYSNYVKNTQFTLNISSDDVHSGEKSLKITNEIDNNDFRMIPEGASSDIGTYSVGEANAGKEYIVSYWYKGTATARFRTGNSADKGAVNWQSPIPVSSESEWKLNTVKITADDSGYLYWYIVTNNDNTESKTIYIDDISLTTVDDAKNNVNKMIKNLDVEAVDAGRAISDIEAWVAALGEGGITEYANFVKKLDFDNDSSNTSALDTAIKNRLIAGDSFALVGDNNGDQQFDICDLVYYDSNTENLKDYNSDTLYDENDLNILRKFLLLDIFNINA